MSIFIKSVFVIFMKMLFLFNQEINPFNDRNFQKIQRFIS